MAAASIQDIIKQHLEAVKTGIIQHMSQQGRIASGRSVASLEVNVSADGGYLEGASSFLTMERGRGPGNVPRNFTSIIRDWIVAKGISYQDLIPKNGTPEQGLTRLAGAIAHSIMTKGTRLYRDHGYNEVFSELLEQEVEKIASETSAVVELEVDELHQEETREET